MARMIFIDKKFTTFEECVRQAERLSLGDLDNRYCVCLKHGAYGVFTIAFAREHDYPVVIETIY